MAGAINLPDPRRRPLRCQGRLLGIVASPAREKADRPRTVER